MTKHDLMLATSEITKHIHNLPTSIIIGNAYVPTKQFVKNFDLTLDCHRSINEHVSIIARICYFEVRRLSSICSTLTNTATATLVPAFVLSRIDYCSSLLAVSNHHMTSHLQWMLNYAAHVILLTPKSSYSTAHLILH